MTKPVTRPHPKRVQTVQGSDIDRLLRQRQGNDPHNRGIQDSPRNLFELDNVNAFKADSGHHLAYNYYTGRHELQRRQFTFTQKGVLIVDETSDLDVEYSGILHKVRLRVKVAPAGSSIIGKLRVNGTDVLTLTLPVGQYVAETTAGVRVHILCPDDAVLLSSSPDLVRFAFTSVDGTAADAQGSVIM